MSSRGFRTGSFLVFAAVSIVTGCSTNNGAPVAGIVAHATPAPTLSASASPGAPTPPPGASNSASPTAIATATASASPTAAASASASPLGTPTTPPPSPSAAPSAVANCATPVPSGNLFYVVTNNAATIDVGAGDFSGTSTQGFGIVQNAGPSGAGLGDPSAVALDPANGYVYISTFNVAPTGSSVEVYLPNFGCTGPVAVLSGSNTVFGNSSGIAVDSAGYVYVADEIARTISLYAPLLPGANNAAPVATLTLPAQAPNPPGADAVSVALDSSGKIYVTSEYENDILVYPARVGTSLSSTPVATIAGGNTRLNNIIGVAFDSSNNIYTMTSNSPGLSNTPSILVFAANPSGTLNEAPVAQIVGAATGLTYPVGIALDRSNVIYVADAGVRGILEFAANPSGTFSEAPTGRLTTTIGSAALYAPYGIAAH